MARSEWRHLSGTCTSSSCVCFIQGQPFLSYCLGFPLALAPIIDYILNRSPYQLCDKLKWLNNLLQQVVASTSEIVNTFLLSECFVEDRFVFILTPSAFSSLLARISCKARTDKDCSNTKAQMDRSGGTFWSHRKTLDDKNEVLVFVIINLHIPTVKSTYGFCREMEEWTIVKIMCKTMYTDCWLQ